MTHTNNPTTITDQAFAEFVEVTKVTVISPDQVSWKNPFGWIKGQESKLDFGILYNIEERVSEGYTTWISPLHDHDRVSFVVGDSVWGSIKTFEKELAWSRFSKEETTRVALGEINQRVVVGLTFQELMPSLDTPYPWGPGDLNTSDTHTVMTHSSTRVSTLRMSTDFSPSDIKMETNTGRIGKGGIHTADGFLWMTEGPDASTLLEEWAKNIL